MCALVFAFQGIIYRILASGELLTISRYKNAKKHKTKIIFSRVYNTLRLRHHSISVLHMAAHTLQMLNRPPYHRSGQMFQMKTNERRRRRSYSTMHHDNCNCYKTIWETILYSIKSVLSTNKLSNWAVNIVSFDAEQEGKVTKRSMGAVQNLPMLKINSIVLQNDDMIHLDGRVAFLLVENDDCDSCDSFVALRRPTRTRKILTGKQHCCGCADVRF